MRPASDYADPVLKTLLFLADAFETSMPWEDISTRRAVQDLSDVQATLAAGVNRTDTTKEVITELGFMAIFESGDVTASFSVGGTHAVSPGLVLIDPPGSGPEIASGFAEGVLKGLAAIWRPDSVAWSDIDILLLSDEMGLPEHPTPGALVWVSEGQRDPFVGGEPLLNGTLHRLADHPRDVDAEVLKNSYRH